MKIVIIHLKNKLSIFQKDKTVMFSRDEVTDSIAKRSQPQKKPDARPRQSDSQSAAARKVDEEISRGEADTEKEEIFELSSSLMDEPLKTRDYPKQEDDIFNLGDESRFAGETGEAAPGELDIPEVMMEDELPAAADEKATRAVDLSKLEKAKAEAAGENVPPPPEADEVDAEPPEPMAGPFADIEELGNEFELKQEDIVIETPPDAGMDALARADADEQTPAPVKHGPRGVDIPVHIEIPEDKDEITINLNLRIVIKRKK
jgi:hypothetical protein